MALNKLPIVGFTGSGSGERPTAAQLAGRLGIYVDTSESPHGVYVCRSNGSGTMTYYALPVCDANGDIPVAFGGMRQPLHFGLANVAAGDNAAVASSTPVAIGFGANGAVVVSWTAPRAGSVTAISAALSANAAGSDLILDVYKNGTLIHSSATITIASGQNEARTTLAKDTATFAAGDNLDVRIRTASGWSATTADLGVSVEVET